MLLGGGTPLHAKYTESCWNVNTATLMVTATLTEYTRAPNMRSANFLSFCDLWLLSIVVFFLFLVVSDDG